MLDDPDPLDIAYSDDDETWAKDVDMLYEPGNYGLSCIQEDVKYDSAQFEFDDKDDPSTLTMGFIKFDQVNSADEEYSRETKFDTVSCRTMDSKSIISSDPQYSNHSTAMYQQSSISLSSGTTIDPLIESGLNYESMNLKPVCGDRHESMAVSAISHVAPFIELEDNKSPSIEKSTELRDQIVTSFSLPSDALAQLKSAAKISAMTNRNIGSPIDVQPQIDALVSLQAAADGSVVTYPPLVDGSLLTQFPVLQEDCVTTIDDQLIHVPNAGYRVSAAIRELHIKPLITKARAVRVMGSVCEEINTSKFRIWFDSKDCMEGETRRKRIYYLVESYFGDDDDIMISPKFVVLNAAKHLGEGTLQRRELIAGSIWHIEDHLRYKLMSKLAEYHQQRATKVADDANKLFKRCIRNRKALHQRIEREKWSVAGDILKLPWFKPVQSNDLILIDGNLPSKQSTKVLSDRFNIGNITTREYTSDNHKLKRDVMVNHKMYSDSRSGQTDDTLLANPAHIHDRDNRLMAEQSSESRQTGVRNNNREEDKPSSSDEHKVKLRRDEYYEEVRCKAIESEDDSNYRHAGVTAKQSKSPSRMVFGDESKQRDNMNDTTKDKALEEIAAMEEMKVNKRQLDLALARAKTSHKGSHNRHKQMVAVVRFIFNGQQAGFTDVVLDVRRKHLNKVMGVTAPFMTNGNRRRIASKVLEHINNPDSGIYMKVRGRKILSHRSWTSTKWRDFLRDMHPTWNERSNDILPEIDILISGRIRGGMKQRAQSSDVEQVQLPNSLESNAQRHDRHNQTVAVVRFIFDGQQAGFGDVVLGVRRKHLNRAMGVAASLTMNRNRCKTAIKVLEHINNPDSGIYMRVRGETILSHSSWTSTKWRDFLHEVYPMWNERSNDIPPEINILISGRVCGNTTQCAQSSDVQQIQSPHSLQSNAQRPIPMACAVRTDHIAVFKRQSLIRRHEYVTPVQVAFDEFVEQLNSIDVPREIIVILSEYCGNNNCGAIETGEWQNIISDLPHGAVVASLDSWDFEPINMHIKARMREVKNHIISTTAMVDTFLSQLPFIHDYFGLQVNCAIYARCACGSCISGVPKGAYRIGLPGCKKSIGLEGHVDLHGVRDNLSYMALASGLSVVPTDTEGAFTNGKLILVSTYLRSGQTCDFGSTPNIRKKIVRDMRRAGVREYDVQFALIRMQRQAELNGYSRLATYDEIKIEHTKSERAVHLEWKRGLAARDDPIPVKQRSLFFSFWDRMKNVADGHKSMLKWTMGRNMLRSADWSREYGDTLEDIYKNKPREVSKPDPPSRYYKGHMWFN
jgi:hypothetical protein